jgi:type IV pilus assembly protein PilC
MQQFKYIAQDERTGKQVTAMAEAQSISDLVSRLKGRQLLPIKIYKARAGEGRKPFSFLERKNVRGKELAIFTRQLATTLSAGLLLTESLETIAEDLENTYLGRIVLQVKEDIEGGSDFSTSLARYPKVFSPSYVSIIKSGEATGSLDKTTTNLAKYLEHYERMKEKIKSAVRYPLFILGFAVLVVLVIVFFLIPKFADMFSGAGAQLPLLTRMVVGISQGSVRYFPFFLAGLILLIVAYNLLIKLPKVRFWVDAAKLRIPIIGKHIIHKALVSRFCSTLGFLLSAGVGLAVSLEITSEVVEHSLFRRGIEKIKDRVVAGSSMSEEIRRQVIFPKLVAKMVSVGERTGEISRLLQHTSEYYEEELEITLQDLTNLLEPALVIFIGGIVLIVVLALYLPIFHMANIIR